MFESKADGLPISNPGRKKTAKEKSKRFSMLSRTSYPSVHKYFWPSTFSPETSLLEIFDLVGVKDTGNLGYNFVALFNRIHYHMVSTFDPHHVPILRRMQSHKKEEIWSSDGSLADRGKNP